MRRTIFWSSLLLGLAISLWLAVPGVFARGGGGGGGHGGGGHGGGGHGGGGHGGHGNNNHHHQVNGFGGGGFYGYGGYGFGGYGYGGYGYGGYGYGGGGYGYGVGYDYPDDYLSDDGQPVRVTVQVPANAELWFNDVKTQLSGMKREFVTPPLAAGNYSYEIRASWDGQTQTRQITVHPGDNITVQFKGKTAPATPP